MATKSKPADKSAATLTQLLGLKDDASETAILAAVEALTKAAEAKIAELTNKEAKLDERDAAIEAAEKAIAERERAVADQEAALKQEADRMTAEIADKAAAVNHEAAQLAAQAFELDAREDELKARVEQLAANPAFVVNEDGSISSVAPADDTVSEDAPPAEGMIRVTVIGPKTGRYRLGRQFTPEPVTLDLTKEEFEAVDADPKLQVWED